MIKFIQIDWVPKNYQSISDAIQQGQIVCYADDSRILSLMVVPGVMFLKQQLLKQHKLFNGLKTLEWL